MAARSLQVTVPIETEVVVRHGAAVQGAILDKERGLLIDLDLRELDWQLTLGLPKRTTVHWEKLRTCEVQELSSFLMPIRYRVRYGDGWYPDPVTGKEHYFGLQEHVRGLDLQRGVTTTALRAAVLLAVLAGVGLRSVCGLLGVLFHLQISKSALGRWVQDVAAALPTPDEMLRRLQDDKAITQGHLDEIFPRGWGAGCVLVLKDESGSRSRSCPSRTDCLAGRPDGPRALRIRAVQGRRRPAAPLARPEAQCHHGPGSEHDLLAEGECRRPHAGS